jgi:molybdate transport system regulatory protein
MGRQAATAVKPKLPVGISLRLDLADGIRLGPGKADVLEGIKETGSIAGAGRRLAMSYKRVWGIVEELNGMFDAPLVEAAKGGKAGGGARRLRLDAAIGGEHGQPKRR